MLARHQIDWFKPASSPLKQWSIDLQQLKATHKMMPVARMDERTNKYRPCL